MLKKKKTERLHINHREEGEEQVLYVSSVSMVDSHNVKSFMRPKDTLSHYTKTTKSTHFNNNNTFIAMQEYDPHGMLLLPPPPIINNNNNEVTIL
jgi:hypothetical protein